MTVSQGVQVPTAIVEAAKAKDPSFSASCAFVLNHFVLYSYKIVNCVTDLLASFAFVFDVK